MGVPGWSSTAALNGAIDPYVSALDGTSFRSTPSALRALMAAIRRLADDQGGALVTAGSSNAYTVTTSSGIVELRAGLRLLVQAHRTNTGPLTLNVDNLGARPWLEATGAGLGIGKVLAGQFYEIVFDAALASWRLASNSIIDIPGNIGALVAEANAAANAAAGSRTASESARAGAEAQRLLSEAARAGSETARDAAAASAVTATTQAGAAALAAVSAGAYPNAYATALPRSVTGTTNLVAGSGGTDGLYGLGVSGGSIAGVTGSFVVMGGTVVRVDITNAGLGAGTVPPTLSFAACPGLTGASATAVVAPVVGQEKPSYWVVTADGLYLALYKNNGSATPAAVLDPSGAQIKLPVNVSAIIAPQIETAITSAYISIGVRNLKRHFGASGSGEPGSDDGPALRNAALSGYYVEVGESSQSGNYGYQIKQPPGKPLFQVPQGVASKLIGIGLPKLLLYAKVPRTQFPNERLAFDGYLGYWYSSGNWFKNFALYCSHQTQGYQLRVGPKPLGTSDTDTDLFQNNEFENIHFFNGNSGIYCYGSRNRFRRIFGNEMRGSVLNFDGYAHHNVLEHLRGRNASGGVGVKGYANNNFAEDLKKWVEPDKYALVAPNVQGDYAIDQLGFEIEAWRLAYPRELFPNLWSATNPTDSTIDNASAIEDKYKQRAKDGFYGGDILSFTANTFLNLVRGIEASGLRDGGFTLNGFRNGLIGGHIHDSAASASAIVGEDCFYVDVTIDNCLNGIQPRSSFGGLGRYNLIQNVNIKNCAEVGIAQIGLNANRAWAPNLLTIKDDPDYVRHANTANGLDSIYNANSPGGTVSQGSIPPTHLGPVLNDDDQDVGAWDSDWHEHDDDPQNVTFQFGEGNVIRVVRRKKGVIVPHGIPDGVPLTFPIMAGLSLPAPLQHAVGYRTLNGTPNRFEIAALDAPTVPLVATGGSAPDGTYQIMTGPSPIPCTITLVKPAGSSLGTITIEAPNHGLVNGRKVRLFDTPDRNPDPLISDPLPLPAPLKANADYFVTRRTANSFQLSEEIDLTTTVTPENVGQNTPTSYPGHSYRAPFGGRWRHKATVPISEGFVPRDNIIMGGRIEKNAVADIRKEADGALHMIGVTGSNGLLSEAQPNALRKTTNFIEMSGTSLDAGSVELTFGGRGAIFDYGVATTSDRITYAASPLGAAVPPLVPGYPDLNPVISIRFPQTNVYGKRAAWDYPGYKPTRDSHDDFDDPRFPKLTIPGSGTLLIKNTDGMPFDIESMPIDKQYNLVRRTGLIAKPISHRPTIRDGWYFTGSDELLSGALGLFNGKAAFTLYGIVEAKKIVSNADAAVPIVVMRKAWDVVLEVRRRTTAVLTDVNLADRSVKYTNDPNATADWDLALGSIATSTPRVSRPTLIGIGSGTGPIEWTGRFQVF